VPQTLPSALTCLFLVLFHASPAKPQETAGSVIQSESRLVLLDTIVTDRKNKHVLDLTQKDFRVFEDNKEQTVTTFSLEAADSDRKRYLVFYFDNSTSTAAQSFARQAAAKFIDANAGPNRQIAIAEYSSSLRVTQNFTDDKERLKQAVLGAHIGRSAISMNATGGGAVANGYSVRTALSALRTMAKSLTPLPGRKTIVFVSGGYPNSQETLDEINSTVETCNRADVAVYPIGSALGESQLGPSADASDNGSARPTGRRGGGGRGAAAQDTSPAAAQQSLFGLAGGTGGFVIVNTNDLIAAFEKVGQDQEAYYVLGYVPNKEAQPGACHSLKVKLLKGGDTVRSRSSYCEAKSLDVLSGTPAERDLEARMNANASPTVTGASLQVPFFYTAANTARVHVALEIPPGTIQFTKEKGRLHAVVNIVGIAWLPDGAVRARFSDSLKVSFDDKKQVEAFNAKPFLYEKQFPIGPGNYSFKVVFSSAANQFGRMEMPLVVEPWDPSKFFLSGLALSRDLVKAKEAIPGIDSELVEDRVALVAAGYEFTPSASLRLKKSQKSYLYAELYEPALTKPGIEEKDVPAVGVHMELLDPATGKTVSDFGIMRLRLPPLTGKPAIPVGLVVNPPDVPAGRYLLRVTAMSSIGKELSRSLAVQIE
jgi:VWFA-related protein